MISTKYFLEKLKDVKANDILALFPMLGAIIVSPLFKKNFKDIWLICEEKKEARDNGYWFFKYMRENHPEIRCIYAIDKKSVDYEKVKNLGEVIQYGGFRHWVLYFTCQHNISSQKGGKPNAAICAFLELNDFYNAHNVFLQHGITINKVRWLYADRSRFDMIITSAKPEYDYITNNFGYAEEIVKLTGFPRFDCLHNTESKKNRVVIMPTWRYWFNLKSKQQDYFDTDIYDSEYLIKWREFLESEKFNQIIDIYGLEVFFYPHRNMQRFLKVFKKNLKSKVIVASWEKYDIQDLLISSSMLITDYSSVFFDTVYMKKPVLFYQFDLEKFRAGQYEQGYFDYQKNPFGKSYSNLNDAIEYFEELVKREFKCDEEFLEGHKEYFPYYDKRNSERVYKEIMQMQIKNKNK